MHIDLYPQNFIVVFLVNSFMCQQRFILQKTTVLWTKFKKKCTLKSVCTRLDFTIMHASADSLFVDHLCTGPRTIFIIPTYFISVLFVLLNLYTFIE